MACRRGAWRRTSFSSWPTPAGPNHTLPTSRAARAAAGLPVFTFLRVRTWMEVNDLATVQGLVEDAIWFGRAEGLEAHARAAERRLANLADPRSGGSIR